MIKLLHEKYCVTGCAGFIGSHLCEEILKQGKAVVGIDNLVAGKISNMPFTNDANFEFVKADVTVLKDFELLFNGVDVVFHEAASKCTVCRKDPLKDLMVNAMGTFNVFNAAYRANVKKVIHASTGSVFQGKPKSFYGVSKLAGESYLRAFKEYYPDFKFTSIRYHHVFGGRQESGGNGGVIPIFITRLLQNEPLTIFGDGFQQRHFTYVKDVVAYNFLAETQYDNEFVDLAEPDSMTILGLAKILGEIMDVQPQILFKPEKPGDIRQFDVCDTIIKRRDFYWVDFRRNLQETIKYYERNRA